MKNFVIALLVTTAALTGPAWAHTQTTLDGDDSPGLLDIAAARGSHITVISSLWPTTGEPTGWTEVHLRLTTYETWSASALAGDRDFVGFEFDFDDDGGPDSCLRIQEDQKSPEADLRGVVFSRCVFDKAHRAGVVGSVRRPDEHTVRVVTTPQLLFSGKAYLPHRWRAVTSYEDDDPLSPCLADPQSQERYGSCVDFTRWKRHKVH